MVALVERNDASNFGGGELNTDCLEARVRPADNLIPRSGVKIPVSGSFSIEYAVGLASPRIGIRVIFVKSSRSSSGTNTGSANSGPQSESVSAHRRLTASYESPREIRFKPA